MTTVGGCDQPYDTEFGIIEGSAGGMVTVYGFKPGTDTFHLAGYGAARSMLTTAGGTTSFTLSDNTHVIVIGVANLTGAAFVQDE